MIINLDIIKCIIKNDKLKTRNKNLVFFAFSFNILVL